MLRVRLAPQREIIERFLFRSIFRTITASNSRFLRCGLLRSLRVLVSTWSVARFTHARRKLTPQKVCSPDGYWNSMAKQNQTKNLTRNDPSGLRQRITVRLPWLSGDVRSQA